MNFKIQFRALIFHASAIAAGFLITSFAGCGSGDPESKMTSYSSSESKAETAELFTVPQDQMAHVQVGVRRKGASNAGTSAHRGSGLQRFQDHPGFRRHRRPRP